MLNSNTKFAFTKYTFCFLAFFTVVLTACGGSSGDNNTSTQSSTAVMSSSNNSSAASSISSVACTTALHSAFKDFGPNVEVALSADGCNVVVETDGKPDHKSPYWDPNGSSGLYEAPGPETIVAQMSPGYIDAFNGQYTLTVFASPKKASKTTASGLGPVGIATSGSPIFNRSEGPQDLQQGTISGFDKNGAHTGPQVYHYHLEPKIISNNDYALVAIVADGFFLYGRKCYSTNAYPTDLDASGGHTSTTQHTGTATSDAEYHYHIKNETYLNSYYLVFPDAYQGTPSAIR
jgi:hypothetical protein